MTRLFLRLLMIAFLATCLVPLVTIDLTLFLEGKTVSGKLVVLNGVLVVAAGIAAIIFNLLLKRSFSYLDSNARKQVEFLDTFDARYLNLAILGSEDMCWSPPRTNSLRHLPPDAFLHGRDRTI
jgi:hypothetical protein